MVPLERVGEAEVPELPLALPGQHVPGLHVQVHDAPGVGVGQPQQQPHEHLPDLRPLHAPAVREQIPALHEGTGQPRAPSRVEAVVHQLQEVGVVQRRGSPHLTLEAHPVPAVLGPLVGQYLDRQVLGAPDLGAAATGNQGLEGRMSHGRRL